MDYNKLTVVKLREVLKARGITSTGLKKAALVARLKESDAATAAAAAEPDQAQTEEPGPEAKTPSPAHVLPIHGPSESATNDAPAPVEVRPVPEQAANSQSTEFEKSIAARSEEKDHSTASVKVPTIEESQQSQPVTAHPSPAVSIQGEDVRVAEAVQASNASLEAPPRQYVSRSPEPIPLRQSSTTTSLNREEISEDLRKRKRRSQSPPPSSADIAPKKSKVLDGSPRVAFPEDTEAESRSGGTAKVVSVENGNSGNLKVDEAQGHYSDTAGKITTAPPTSNIERDPPLAISATPAPESTSAIKNSPSNTRFKPLFSAPTKESMATPGLDEHDAEDREIAPALHPATTALYIRNFSRPLHPGQLKAHLISLAQPSKLTPDPDSILEFFLDTIRTHGLIRFSTVAAASRVRMALHDRVWPEERTRKPLWVDFVPEEKLKKWIEVEQEAANSRGQAAKRWEVVYEEENGSIAAYLQEVDNGPKPSGKKDEPRALLQPADAKLIRPAHRGDPGKGFKALDDLFKSTTAKPKLYFQPVSQFVANSRLGTLAAGRGGGRNDEMRRFSFEEEKIVDRGPEFGAGWRGGLRGRGGGYGGNMSRGGHRDGGESWRGGR